MEYIADLHSHSKYSRAVSPQMTLPVISEWCVRKGIDIVGTGDFTHPLWFKELGAQLEEAGEGVYRLKRWEMRSETSHLSSPPLFLLSTEVAAIYSQGGKGRRIHLLIFAPDFAAVEKMNKEFAKRGMNLFSDGRPILGMSARDILQLVLEADERCLVIPAHAWTPWFSLYGSFSGFDSIEECFGDLAPYIYGIETGLSSDPAMNWRIADLKTRSILSFSDAHSPQKLGRELTVFELPKLNYGVLREAIVAGPAAGFPLAPRRGSGQASALSVPVLSVVEGSGPLPPASPATRITYTLEFYPAEGKYHYTGHRNCNVRHSPQETKDKGTICSVCNRPLTVGVMHRVEQLANNSLIVNHKRSLALRAKSLIDAYGIRWMENSYGRPKYVMMVPLLEILAESLETQVSSQKVINEYRKLTDEYKNEVAVLLRIKGEEIERISGPKVREGIEKVRRGDIVIDPGFDGVFGKVTIWSKEKVDEVVEVEKVAKEQMGLF